MGLKPNGSADDDVATGGTVDNAEDDDEGSAKVKGNGDSVDWGGTTGWANGLLGLGASPKSDGGAFTTSPKSVDGVEVDEGPNMLAAGSFAFDASSFAGSPKLKGLEVVDEAEVGAKENGEATGAGAGVVVGPGPKSEVVGFSTAGALLGGPKEKGAALGVGLLS